jgi:hypothetical protein
MARSFLFVKPLSHVPPFALTMHLNQQKSRGKAV